MPGFRQLPITPHTWGKKLLKNSWNVIQDFDILKKSFKQWTWYLSVSYWKAFGLHRTKMDQFGRWANYFYKPLFVFHCLSEPQWSLGTMAVSFLLKFELVEVIQRFEFLVKGKSIWKFLKAFRVSNRAFTRNGIRKKNWLTKLISKFDSFKRKFL